jgi:hypothetical protein
MSLLIPIEAFDNFKEVKDFPITEIPVDVLSDVVQKVRELDEREEFEPWLRSILADGAQTPQPKGEANVRMKNDSTSATTPHLEIYTDGACEPNPGPGGYGVVLLHPKKRAKNLWPSSN